MSLMMPASHLLPGCSNYNVALSKRAGEIVLRHVIASEAAAARAASLAAAAAAAVLSGRGHHTPSPLHPL